ncbi:conserved Plasmodium protein, unknown function [Plasmodium berghei]|uniref:Uncharacterized protein n=2 Tax=Plasmodium berghei TaxID=5821 RepID=A0A509ASR2_PLABA|nr:conserved Plasmodium protein, unknown function [Plasmodium berghei ANKA]CXJ17724.1 conserved Plasmodium protein, unknown function [Plasmodium berghei]SCM26392.1 conserved Plasmodium protein, unknown function [Plasmodium berghei]SCN28432.1 conserved Plasmodium protein, unknown function [Plasmodium berghei]SCO62625.1 conserved Plasmodium protein, unknown function [Plasmodium berghei]SCO64184.1 conserved Plasmodium protein, unknown function [Plasmodium berghei]|eukprot:XP_034424080.1 conserved Plasmodium protein, unknown function [Plasmodium berghei ANKA]
MSKNFYKVRCDSYLKLYHRNIVTTNKKTKIYYKNTKLDLYVPFNKNINMNHERLDSNFYSYDINSSIYRILKYVHILKKKSKTHNNNNTKTDKKELSIDKQIEQIFICYISLYKNIEKNMFLKLTLEVLKCPKLNKKIMNDNEFYQDVVFEILNYDKKEGIDNKTHFYEFVIKILSIFIKNNDFFEKNFQKIFFLQILENINREENINNYMNNFTFLLSCITHYNRNLKNQLAEICENNSTVLLKNAPTNDKNILIIKEKKQIIQNSITIILNIFNKIKIYNYFNDTDICNIFDFLNEFKRHHTIKNVLCKDVHKYFTVSSEIKNLCLFLYFLSSCKYFLHYKNINKEAYKYIYNIIVYRKNELNDLNNMNLFLLAILKHNTQIKQEVNMNIQQNTKKLHNVVGNNKILGKFEKRKKQNQNIKRIKNIRNTKLSNKIHLCLKLKKNIIQKRKMRNQKNLYFFIKHTFSSFLKTNKLSNKYKKTFYQYFLLYHIKKSHTRKKNYKSPCDIIRNLN